MKKKNLKSLSLKKASVSNLNGGAPAPDRPLTFDIRQCGFTIDIRQCTWISELNTACHCESEWINTCTIA